MTNNDQTEDLRPRHSQSSRRREGSSRRPRDRDAPTEAPGSSAGEDARRDRPPSRSPKPSPGPQDAGPDSTADAGRPLPDDWWAGYSSVAALRRATDSDVVGHVLYLRLRRSKARGDSSRLRAVEKAMAELETRVGPGDEDAASSESGPTSEPDAASSESGEDPRRETARRIVRDLDYRYRRRQQDRRPLGPGPSEAASTADSTLPGSETIAGRVTDGVHVRPLIAEAKIETITDELGLRIKRWYEEMERKRKKAGEWAKKQRHQRWRERDVRRYLAREHAKAEDRDGSDYRVGATARRPTPSSEEFLRQTQGDLPDGLFVDTDRFLALPRRVVDDILEASAGGLTWGDSVRMEVAIVSYLAGLTAEQPDGECVIEYEHGETVTVDDGEIIVSMQKVARALYQRFYFYPTRRTDINADPAFTAFYRSVVRAFDRLSDTPILDHRGPAIDTGDKSSDAYGQRFRVNMPGLHSLPLGSSSPSLSLSPMAPAGPYVDTFAVGLDDGTEVVDVPALFDRLVREHTGQWETFAEQAAKSTQASDDPSENFRVAERAVKGFQWQRRQARPSTVEGGVNSRHVTTGAYKESRATSEDRAHLPCTIPFIVVEIDGETVALCLEYARRIVRWLASIDVPLDLVTVTYTGNTSFHIRLPAGLFGQPIFRSTRKAAKTIQRFYELVEGAVEDRDGAWIDGALSSPLHHIRAVGSVHEGLYSRSDKVRHCVGFTAPEILDYSLGAIRQYSVHYDGYTLPDPSNAPRHDGLVELLLEAHQRDEQTVEVRGERENRGIMGRILETGVEEGEEFGPGLVGRNLAARLVSLHLLQSGLSHQDAWLKVQDWNEKNGPPIGEAPDDYTGELRYVFDRGADDAPHL